MQSAVGADIARNFLSDVKMFESMLTTYCILQNASLSYQYIPFHSKLANPEKNLKLRGGVTKV